MKVLCIAPYSGLAEIAKNMEMDTEIDLDVTYGNLETGVQAAQLAEKQGYELIISRGGTATMIQENVTIPVVHIDVTGYDMLRVLTLIRDIKESVALVGFANISQGAKTICNILEYDVKMVTITSRNEVKSQLESLKSQGFSVVIGDVVTVETAQQVGLRGILITSGKEAFLDALEEAKRVYHLVRKMNNQLLYLRKTFHSIPYPMVLLGRDCEIIEKNLLFEQNVQQHDMLSSPAIAKTLKKVLETERIQWINVSDDQKHYDIQAFLVDKQQDIVGLVIYEMTIETKSNAIHIKGDPVFTPIIGDSEQTQQLRTNIKQYSYLDENVCLVGESGTGKCRIAEAMHFARFGQDSPIIIIEGKYLTTAPPVLERLERLLKTMEQGTIILHHAELLSADTQEAVRNILFDKNSRIKLISLVNETDDSTGWQHHFEEDFYQLLTSYTLHISPLRNKKEDIRALSEYFIMEFHTEKGSETIGIKREAVDYIMQYEWPGNICQLKKFMKELSLTNPTHYIEVNQVKHFMDPYMMKKDINDQPLLQGTLEEIEKEIIKLVLKEEGNNQTKTAQRLGINRSTLWRKLQ